MAVRVNKSAFNIREKLNELTKRFGLKGSELAAAKTVQEARDLVSAGRKNMVINGDFKIDQRGKTGTVANGSNEFHADRFVVRDSGSGTISAQTSSNATTNPPGFRSWFQVNCTATDGLPSSNEYVRIQHLIEGYNCNMDWGLAGGNTDYVTVSFWVKSNQTGIHCVSLEDGDTLPVHVKEYNIDQADTWQKITATFPPPNTGSFRSRDSNAGLKITWCLSTGTAYQTTKDVWVNTYEMGTSNMVNFMDSTSNYFYITGVQCEVGKNATDFEYRSYAEELALCQRYYYKLSASENYTRWATGWAISGTQATFLIKFPVSMRTITSDPILTGTVQASDGVNSLSSTTATNVGNTKGTDGASLRITTASGLVQYRPYYLESANGTGNSIAFSAEF